MMGRADGWTVMGRAGLATLLAVMGVILAVVVVMDWPSLWGGGDALRYWWGARDFLDGLSPWDRFFGDGSYFGSPTTILAFVPFALLPLSAFLVIWAPIVVGSAVYIVRRLRLGWWWLLYPPLVDGVLRLQPTVVIVALILVGAGGLAAALKVIALAPIAGEFRWRSVVAFVTLSAASFVVAPGLWIEYLQRFGELSGLLLSQLGGGPTLLTIPAALACLALGPRRAGWLVIPAVWPGWEYHYALLLLPVAGPVALAAALPWREAVQVAVIAMAAIPLWRGRPRLNGWWRRWCAPWPTSRRDHRRASRRSRCSLGGSGACHFDSP